MRLSKDGATEQCAKGGESFPGPIGPAGQRTLNLDRALCRGAGTKGIELFPPPPDPLRLRQHFFSDTSDEPQGGVLCLGARREHAERGTSGDSGVGRPDPERSGGSLAGGLRGRPAAGRSQQALPFGSSSAFPPQNTSLQASEWTSLGRAARTPGGARRPTPVSWALLSGVPLLCEFELTSERS